MSRIKSYIYSFIFLALICPNNLYAQVASGSLNGHDYVDLGLSVKWATCNVGATKPSDYGNYYAWGETSTKSSYTQDNSKTYNNDSYHYDINSNSSLDAATANWGGSWRMPTEKEFQELLDNCTWTWTEQDGHDGYKVTSKNNGNSMFLPAAGGRRDTSLVLAGEYVYYWSSTPVEGFPKYSYGLCLSYRDSLRMHTINRGCATTIRPVTR